VVNATPRPLYPRERNTIPIIQEAVWTLVLVGAENLATPAFDSWTFRPVAELLYRLHYSGNSLIKEPVSLLRDKSLFPAETGMSSQRPQRQQRYRASYQGVFCHMIKIDKAVTGRDLECVECGVLSLCPINPLKKQCAGTGNISTSVYKYVWNFDIFRHFDKTKIYRLLHTKENMPKFLVRYVEVLLLL
jgi:hypothetical protein